VQTILLCEKLLLWHQELFIQLAKDNIRRLVLRAVIWYIVWYPKNANNITSYWCLYSASSCFPL